MYSDFILDKQPTTVEETLRTFEDISSNIGNKENEYKYSSPMFAHMIPINVVGFFSKNLFRNIKNIFFSTVLKKIKWSMQ